MDRMNELDTVAATTTSTAGGNEPYSPTGIAQQQLALTLVSKKATEVNELVAELRHLSAQLQLALVESRRSFQMTATGTSRNGEEESHLDRVKRLTELGDAQAKLAMRHLNEIRQAITYLERNDAARAENESVLQIYNNQLQHLSRAFQTALAEFQASRQEVTVAARADAVRRVKMQFTTADGRTQVDDAEAERIAHQMLDLEQPFDALMATSREHLAQVLETRDELKKIERSARELNAMFSDLAVILEEHRAVIDMTGGNVGGAIDHVVEGRRILRDAHEEERGFKHRTVCLIVVVVVILALILAITLGFTIKKS